jgi:gas vesicle protein
MSKQSGYNGSHVMMAFLGGAAAGAAVAYLTAPKSGRETREDVRGYAQSGVDQGRALPGAMKAAGGAARDAFASSMNESNDHRSQTILRDPNRKTISDGVRRTES